MKQLGEKQAHESPKQESAKQQDRLSLKVWLLKKLLQYTDGTFQVLFTAASLGGALWIAQHLWGLRLLPFNILDTILLVVVTAIVLFGAISLLFWLGLRGLLIKHPGFFVLLGFMALLPFLMKTYPKFFSFTFDGSLKKEQPTPPRSDAASEQGDTQYNHNQP